MSLYVQGMHGLGDNIHQRAVLRLLLEQHDEIWLETSWPSVYHDMPRVRCIAKGTRLRTQLANAQREADKFAGETPDGINARMRIWYTPHQVRSCGSVLGAMCVGAGVSHDRADFRMPVPEDWIAQARRIVGSPARPILVYRPLVERTEWSGCAARNPDRGAYGALFAGVRDRFHVVSVADLVPGVEWIVSHPIKADAEFHGGELPFEVLAGLFSIASMVWASPGFAVPLAQAVGTPVVCIFGGYESSRSFSSGARHSRYLGIDPRRPCECFQHRHACAKDIDLTQAAQRIEEFIHVLD